MRNFIILSGLLTILISCHKIDNLDLNDQDSYIFGKSIVCCTQPLPCSEFYKIEGGLLFKDSIRHYPNPTDTALYSGNFLLITDSLYQLVKNIPQHQPAALDQEMSHIIVNADSTCQTIYFGKKVNGVVHFWLMPADENQCPAYLAPFVHELDSLITLIN